MNEAYLKSRLVKAILQRTRLAPEAVRRHEDKFTGGGPDLSVTRSRRTVWAEVKFDRPRARARFSALQDLALRALDGLRVTYAERGRARSTKVVDARGSVLLYAVSRRWEHDAVARVIEQQLDAAVTDHERVLAFHRKFDLGEAAVPHFDAAVTRRRLDHLREELHEIYQSHIDGDVVGVADGLVDLVHVAHGAAIELGLPWPEMFAEVSRANLEKTRDPGDDSGHKQGVRKPPGWRGPDIRAILQRHGFNPTLHTPSEKEAA